ncbi:hypothetical protein BMS3Bbin02_00979 [bacterium BMS3Bbin02]|nr:hypothetical protein BMS3Bbin02_00979 [bacterium BMS3Bbin02]
MLELFRESWETLRTGRLSTMFAFAIVLVLLAGSMMAEMLTQIELATIQDARYRNGEDVFIAIPERGIEAFTVADCLALNHVPGVARSGALVSQGTAAIRNLGGAGLVAVVVAGNMLPVWTADGDNPVEGLAIGPLASGKLGVGETSLVIADLGVLSAQAERESSSLGVSVALLGATPREPDVAGWLVVQRLDPDSVPAGCWIESVPGATASVKAVAGSLLATEGRAPVTRDLVASDSTFDLAEKFETRWSKRAWLLSAGVWTLFGLLINTISRQRWALYLAVGLQRTDLVFIEVGRILLLLAAAWLTAGLLAIVFAATLGIPELLSREAALTMLAQGTLVSTALLALTPLTLVVLAGVSLVEMLRE